MSSCDSASIFHLQFGALRTRPQLRVLVASETNIPGVEFIVSRFVYLSMQMM